jgi:multidrug resistance efflux pump
MSAVLAVAVGAAWFVGWSNDDAGADVPAAIVTRGTVSVRLHESGTFRAGEFITYRSPEEHRELEVLYLAPEGVRVVAGDVIVRLDAMALERERDRLVESAQQAELDLTVAEAEWKTMNMATAEEGDTDREPATSDIELTATVQLAERRLERARRDAEDLKPLLASGFVTRSEYESALLRAEEAEIALRVARRRIEEFETAIRPRARQQAALQATQQSARRASAVLKVQSIRRQIDAIERAIDACSIRARTSGIVMYEEYASGTARRRVRVGDRVTPTQGIVTIPNLETMVVVASVREGDVHRLKTDMPVEVRPEALPDLVLPGRLLAIGTMAQSAPQGYNERRFDITVSLAASHDHLRPDMSARVTVKIADRMNVIRVPINAVFGANPEHLVYVRTADGIQTRRLQLGAIDEQHYEVIAGVIEGDVVLLERPGDVHRRFEARTGTP